MSPVLDTQILDAGLEILPLQADKIYVCSQMPASFVDATINYALGAKSFGVGNVFGAPANASPSGRQVASNPIVDGLVTRNGTPTVWAVVDSVNSRLLAAGPLSGAVGIAAGQTFQLDSFTIQEGTGVVWMIAEGANGAGVMIGTASVVNVNDGSGGAPIGAAIPHPNALVLNNPGVNEYGATYVVRPSFLVPGVDYGVGPPAGTVFKTPGVDADPNGASSNPAARQMVVTGNGVLVKNWDFTINGGWQLLVTTGENVTIDGNKFKVGVPTDGGAYWDPIYFFTSGDKVNGNFFIGSHGNCFIINNDIDGGGTPTQYSQILTYSQGNYTIQYNHIHNGWIDLLHGEGGSQPGDGNMDVRFNVIENANLDSTDPDVHGDWWQFNGGNYPTVRCEHNLLIQGSIGTPGTGPNSGTQGITPGGHPGNPVFGVVTILNNVVITRPVTGFGTITYVFSFDPTAIGTSMTVAGNFFDTLGIKFKTDYGAPMPGNFPAYIYHNTDAQSGQNGTLFGSNNVAMADVLQPEGATSPGTFLLAGGSVMPFPDDTQ